MRLLLHENGSESPLKEIPDLAMAAIKDLCVDLVELPHPAGEIRLGCLDQQMIVIVHQTVGMAKPSKPADHLTEHSQLDMLIYICVTMRCRALPRLVM